MQVVPAIFTYCVATRSNGSAHVSHIARSASLLDLSKVLIIYTILTIAGGFRENHETFVPAGSGTGLALIFPYEQQPQVATTVVVTCKTIETMHHRRVA